MTQPEQEARNKIDELLRAAGWVVSNVDAANITAHRVAIREFPLKSGHGFADYLLYVNCGAAAAEAAATYDTRGETFLSRPQHLPVLKTGGLWPAQMDSDHNVFRHLSRTIGS